MEESMMEVHGITLIDIGGWVFTLINLAYLPIFILAVIFHRRLYQRLNFVARLGIALVYVAGIVLNGSLLLRMFGLNQVAEDAIVRVFDAITRFLLALAAFAIVLILRFLLPEHRRKLRDSSFVLIAMLPLVMAFGLYISYRGLTASITVDNYMDCRTSLLNNGMLTIYLMSILGFTAMFVSLFIREWRDSCCSALNLSLFLGILFFSLESPIIPFVWHQQMQRYFKEYLTKYPELPGMTQEERWHYREAVDKGDAESLYQLARCYEKGDGMPQDMDKAVKWYRKAAEQGHGRAIDALERLK